MNVEVRGLKENLRILNSLNPALRKEWGKRFRAIAKPAADEANARRKANGLPEGFQHSGRTGARQDKTVRVRMNTRKARNRNAAQGAKYETVGVVVIQTRAAASAIADMAGKVGHVQTRGRSRPYPGRPTGHKLSGQGRHLIAKLNKEFGEAPSRFMWPSVEDALPDVENQIRQLAQDLEKDLNNELAKINTNVYEVRGQMR